MKPAAPPPAPAAVCVWPHVRVPGWPRSAEDFSVEELYPVVPLVEALERRYYTDAHFSAALVLAPDGPDEAQPRLTLASPGVLASDPGAPAPRVALSALVLDLDRREHRRWPDEAAAAAAVRALAIACPEAGVYATPSGARLVWALTEPVDHSDAYGTLSALADLVAPIVAAIPAPAPGDLEVDPVSDQWTRAYRLPRVRRDGIDLDLPLDLTALRVGRCISPPTPGSRTRPARRAVPTPTSEPLDVEGLRDLADGLPAGVWDALRGVDGIPWGALRTGRPYADAGARDVTLTRGVGATVSALLAAGAVPPGYPLPLARLAAAVWVESVLGMSDADADAPAPEKLWYLAWRFAAADAGPEAPAETEGVTYGNEHPMAPCGPVDRPRDPRSADPGVQPPVSACDVVPADGSDGSYRSRSQGVTYGNEHPMAPGGPVDRPLDPRSPDPVAPRRAVEVLDDETDVFTAEGFAAAEAAALTPRAVPPAPGPPVVVWGSRYIVRDELTGEYGPIVSGAALVSEIVRRAPSAPVRSGKGTLRSDREILADLGVVAERLVYHYAVPKDREGEPGAPQITEGWDADRHELRRVVCASREIVPRRDPLVERWLRELAGGDDAPDWAHGALLDWLATVADLDIPTAALYLRTGPGVGKTLFARGVGAVWGDVVVSYDEVSGQFAAGLLEAPIVHLSEGARRDKGTSAAFRALTADQFHRLDKKHVDPMQLIGNPRLIVSANNDDALPLTEGHHTADDLAALLGRVLYLRCSMRARDVLAEVPRATLRTWPVPGGAIPRHIAWLRARRGAAVRARLDRYLVEGRETPWHRGLLMRSGANEGVLVAVAEGARGALRGQTGAVYLEPGTAAGATSGVTSGAEVEGWGTAWVNVSALYALTAAAVADRPISRADLARTIRDLSAATESRVVRTGSGRDARQMRAWPIPGDLVVAVADSHGMDHADALRAALAPTHHQGANP